MHIKKIFVVCFIFVLAWSLKVTSVYALPDPVEASALKFLERVARITPEENYFAISLDKSSGRVPDSQHFQTSIKVVFSDGLNKFETLTTFVKERFWMYCLYPLSYDYENELTLEDCLIIANQSIIEYGANFNAKYCDTFAQMLSIALQTQSLIVENNNYLLKIKSTESCSTIWEKTHCVQIQLFEKINEQFVTPFRSIYISISKSGLVTEFVDHLGVYTVATTSINVSEQEAINIATSYIKAYAQKHQQEIKEINAKCEFIKDISCSRGDSFIIYPHWHIMAMFDKTNEENVCGYSVMIWADNGKVYHHGPQGYYLPKEKNDIASSLMLLLLATITVSFLGAGLLYARLTKTRRKKNE